MLPARLDRQLRKDLVEHIDVAALSLAAAGITIPEKMEASDILAKDYQSKAAVFAARDRCGEAVDRIRSVRTERYLYIRNYFPQRPHLMPSSYKDGKLIIKRLRELHAKEALNPLATKLLFSPTRPSEELYLYGEDVWQVRNLAEEVAHAKVLEAHRKLLDDWIVATKDPGPETPEVYILETKDQLKTSNNKIYRQNTEVYKQWAREGK